MNTSAMDCTYGPQLAALRKYGFYPGHRLLVVISGRFFAHSEATLANIYGHLGVGLPDVPAGEATQKQVFTQPGNYEQLGLTGISDW